MKFDMCIEFVCLARGI